MHFRIEHTMCSSADVVCSILKYGVQPHDREACFGVHVHDEMEAVVSSGCELCVKDRGETNE